MSDRDQPKAAEKAGTSLMTRPHTEAGVDPSPRRLVGCGVMTHHRPSKAGHLGNPGPIGYLSLPPDAVYIAANHSRGENFGRPRAPGVRNLTDRTQTLGQMMGNQQHPEIHGRVPCKAVVMASGSDA